MSRFVACLFAAAALVVLGLAWLSAVFDTNSRDAMVLSLLAITLCALGLIALGLSNYKPQNRYLGKRKLRA